MTVLEQPRVLGRYLVYASIASGGMATVYLGRMAGPKGFSRIIAIKKLHAQFVHDTDFVTMFLDEAQLIGRIHHSNVVAPIDVVEADGDLCIVMEYVHGEALGRLMRLSRQNGIPLRVVTAIMVQTLLGLHAAHEVTDGDGQPLSIVHRDVSPQNILVGEDGITRVVDFGIAKAAHRARPSDTGKLKGKLGYMAPEQFLGGALDRRCDVFSAGIILWEMLTSRKLFAPADPIEATERMKRFEPSPPSSIVPEVSPELDAITLRALSSDPNSRFPTAHDMARALESACSPASAIEVAEWVQRLVGDTLSTRAAWIQELVSLDLSEWTLTYVMSTSVPPPANTEDTAEREIAEKPPRVSRLEVIRPDSLSATHAPARQTARNTLTTRRLTAGALLLLVLGLAAVGFAWRSRAPLQTQAAAGATASTTETRERGAPAVSTQPEPSSVNSRGADQVDNPVGTSGEPTQKPDVAATHQQPAAARTANAVSRSDCRIPYVIDAKHIKRFRPECFRRR